MNVHIAWVVLLSAACTRDNGKSAGAPAAPASRSTAAAGSVAAPASAAPEAPASAVPSVSVEGGEWTAGIVERKAAAAGVTTLRAVRAARHDALDRIVFEFEGTRLGGYRLEYVDRPVRRCGSGDVAELAGDAWLAVTFEPAAAHTEAGEPTLTAREQQPRLPIVREIELTCDFEAQVSVVLGMASPNRFRVLELASPPRLVVDVRHRPR